MCFITYLKPSKLKMENDKEICVLNWNKYERNITKGINSLRNVDDFYDVTLVGDDLEQVTAHRLVLSASSEYLLLSVIFQLFSCKISVSFVTA